MMFLIMSFYLNLCWCSCLIVNLCVFHCKFISQTENKAYTHDTNSFKEANRKGRCVRKTKTITNSFKMFLVFWVFRDISQKGYCVWLFLVGARQNYCVSHLSSRGSDGGLTIQVSSFQDKPNIRCYKGYTPEVVGWHHRIIRIYAQTSSTRCRRRQSICQPAVFVCLFVYLLVWLLV